MNSEVSWSTQGGVEKAELVVHFELSPRQRLLLEFRVAQLWDAGEFAAKVILAGRALGSIHAQKLRVPFGIELSTSGSDAQPLHAKKGEPLLLNLRNKDALNYALNWELVLDGEGGGARTARAGCDSPTVALPASSDLPLRVCLPEPAFPGFPGAWFVEEVRRGVLKVSYAEHAGPAPSPTKVFPVVVGLGARTEAQRRFACLVLTGFVLVLGGLCSLFLTHAIPNSFQRLALRQKLEPLAARTKGLSDHVPARLRVELRVSRLGLSQRIEHEQVFFSGATEGLEEIASEVQILERRVDLIGRMDDWLRRIEVMGSDGPPALLLEQQQALLGHMAPLEGPAPSTSELDAAEAGIASVKGVLERIEDDDAELRESVIEAARKFLTERFEPAWSRVPGDQPWAAQLKSSASGIVDEARLRFGKEAEDAGEPLAKLDTLFEKAVLIAEYIRVCMSATEVQRKRFDDTGVRAKPGDATQRERFFECLSGAGSRTLAQARLVLREAEQGIFVKQIVEQLEQGKFAIKIEPQYTLVYDRIAFSFVFHEDKFNDAAARAKLDCEWTFSHGADKRVENCWEAFQFFSSPGQNFVYVVIRRGAETYYSNAGAPSPNPATVTVRSRKNKLFRERTALELTRLGVALAVTMGALMTGARDQLQHLDLAPGIAAIFAIGFGADVVKNLVSRRVTAPSTNGI